MGSVFTPNHKPDVINNPHQHHSKNEPVSNTVASPIETDKPFNLKERLIIIGCVIALVCVPATIASAVTHFYDAKYLKNNKQDQVLKNQPVLYTLDYNNLTIQLQQNQIISDELLNIMQIVVDQQLTTYNKNLYDLTNNSVYVELIKKKNELDKKIEAYNVHITTYKQQQQTLNNIFKSNNNN